MAFTVRQASALALTLAGHVDPPVTYTTTAKMVVDIALTALNHVGVGGTIDATREAKYYAMAIPLINDLQATICHAENAFEVITPIAAITSILSVSDDNATRILPTGLAMKFALADNNILSFNVLSSEYYQSKWPDMHIIFDGDSNKYAVSAPSFCELLQSELLPCEGNYDGSDPITTLDDVFSLTDDTARRVLPHGLAAQFALIDENNNLYQVRSAEYEKFKQSIHVQNTHIHDAYHANHDINLQY